MMRRSLTAWTCWSAIMTLAAAEAITPTVVRPPSQVPARPVKLLYVMEYDCKFDWEPVHPEKGVTDEVLAWLMGLHDRLTVTAERPLGEDLMASLL